MNKAVKALVILVALAAAVVILFTYVFPWFDATFITDPTL